MEQISIHAAEEMQTLSLGCLSPESFWNTQQ